MSITLKRASRIPQEKQALIVAGLRSGKTHAAIAAEAGVSLATIANYSKLLKSSAPAPNDTLAIVRMYKGGGSLTLDEVSYLEDAAKHYGLTVQGLISLFLQAQDNTSKLYGLIKKLEAKA